MRRATPIFQSTPPVKAATECGSEVWLKRDISIHAAREGGDYNDLLRQDDELRISIHAAREGGDTPTWSNAIITSGISIHAAREGGDERQHIRRQRSRISIHAAREGGDKIIDNCDRNQSHFNPRRP